MTHKLPILSLQIMLFICINLTAKSQYDPWNQPLSLSTQSLFDEVNYARANPKAYAKILEERLSSYSGGEKTTCKEAIAFLKKQPARKAYVFSRALGQAAFDHCQDMNNNSFFDHIGSNGSGPAQRIAKYGKTNRFEENIAAGSMIARDAIVMWIVDHGVASRGHRKAIYSDESYYMGIAWDKHPSCRAVQCADFAPSSFTSKFADDNVMFEFAADKKPEVATQQPQAVSTSKPAPSVKVGQSQPQVPASSPKPEEKKNQTEELIDEAAKLLKQLFK